LTPTTNQNGLVNHRLICGDARPPVPKEAP
jgi:hypothetical protein